MPLLNFPEFTQGYARFLLISLYKNHPPFVKQHDELKKPYIEIIRKYTEDTLTSFQEKPQSNVEYYQTMTKYLLGESRVSPFTREQEKDIEELKPYFDELIKLVDKWIFKVPWAVGTLFLIDMTQFVVAVPSEEQKNPLMMFEKMVPWSPPLPPLKIEVSAWTFFEYSRDEIMNEIADMLFEYEEELKKIGIKEFPSSLLRHAKWWFEHYVNGKTYDAIASEGIKTGKGETNPYPKNIRLAVRKFSKLIGIEIRE